MPHCNLEGLQSLLCFLGIQRILSRGHFMQRLSPSRSDARQGNDWIWET